MKNFPYYRQLDQRDCGPTCLRMIAKFYGKHYSAQTMREAAQISKNGVSMLGLSEGAERLGFRTVGVSITVDKLIDEVTLPAILHWNQNHFVVLYAIEKRHGLIQRDFLRGIWGGKEAKNDFHDFGTTEDNVSFGELRSRKEDTLFYIADPAKRTSVFGREDFEKHWIAHRREDRNEGIALLLEPTPQFFEEEGETTRSNMGGLTSMFGYLRQYRRLAVQVGIGMIAGSGIQLIFPILTQSVVDVGVNTRNISFIYLVLIAQLALVVGRHAIEFLRSWILLHISVRVNLVILSEFLSKLMRLPLSFFDTKRYGDIIQRIGDHNRIETFLTGQALTAVFSLFNLVVFGLTIAFYDLKIFCIAFVTLFVHLLWILVFLRYRRTLDTKRFAISSQNQSQLIQLIQGMQDIKIAGAEMSKRWEWERIQAKLFKWNVKNLSLSQYQAAGSLLINEGKNVVITFFAAKAVIDGQITLGGMMSIQYIVSQFNAPVNQFVNLIQGWQDAQMSMERLGEIINMEDEEKRGELAIQDRESKCDIHLEGLSYTYPGAGNDPVLNNVNLLIPYGKTTAVVGMSGSGKTTLLKLLLRFYEPNTGEITLRRSETFDGSLPLSERHTQRNHKIKLSQISHSSWRLQCGVVMQDGFIFSDSIARNIAVGDEIIDMERLQESAFVANIHEFVATLPLGYHTKIGGDGKGISQGQKQRILIARAVYKNPRLFLFDEATNALDAKNEMTIVRNLEEFFKGKTVVVVAHRLSTVRNADQIVVMEHGAVVECGTHEDLVNLRGKYFDLVSNQLQLNG